MRAWRFAEFGDISNFKLGECPKPEPGAREVLIRVAYAALNPADRLLVEGKYPGAGKLPLTVGRDGSGVVEGVGADCRLRSGDRVLVLRSEVGITRQGTLAEYVVAPEESVAPVPEGWSMQEAAAASVAYLTAWKTLVNQGGLREGETVLVTGASGGVGIAAVQLAKILGARVVALSRNEAHRARLLELGADYALNAAAPDLEKAIRGAVGTVNLTVENVAGPFIQTSLNLSALNSRIMVIGLLAGHSAQVSLGALLFNQVRIEGVHVGKMSPEDAQRAFARVVKTLRKGDQRPLVGKVFEFEAVQDAFMHLAAGHLGKVLVRIGGDT
ncbi:MAG: zinc-binding dehydrogenase [Candidatus Hydrogenedentota bacterium]